MLLFQACELMLVEAQSGGQPPSRVNLLFPLDKCDTVIQVLCFLIERDKAALV